MYCMCRLQEVVQYVLFLCLITGSDTVCIVSMFDYRKWYSMYCMCRLQEVIQYVLFLCLITGSDTVFIVSMFDYRKWYSMYCFYDVWLQEVVQYVLFLCLITGSDTVCIVSMMPDYKTWYSIIVSMMFDCVFCFINTIIQTRWSV